MVDPVLSAKSHLANLHRRPTATPAEFAEARRALTTANCARAIEKALAADPAPTKDQLTRLAALLTGGDQ